MSHWVRRGVAIGWRVSLGAAVVIGLMWVRSLAEARHEVSRAAAMAASGNVAGATQARARAVRWSAPLNPYASRALVELLDTARTFEAAGQAAAALTTYRAARGSLRASAGVLQAHRAALELSDDHIAALSVRGRALPLEADLSGESRRSEVRAQLRPVEGRSGADLLALLGFVAWVGAAFGLAGLAHASHVDVPATAKRGLCTLCVVGFVCFGVGLWAA